MPDNLAPHAAPVQPLPFSHKAHAARGLQCRFCHTNRDPGNQMSFPSTTLCMGCHGALKSKVERLEEFARSGRPIPWQRVYQVTPGVTWTHRKHLVAGMQCGMCHGDVAQLDAMAENTGVTSMASCISCHDRHKVSAACQTCHAWPAS